MTDKENIRAEIEEVKLIIQANRAQDAFAEGYLLGQESVVEHLEKFIDSMPKEPANEDLEKEINRFFNEWQNVLCDEDCCNEGGFCCVLNEELKPVSLLHCRKIAKHFANWQKQQMLKDAVGGEVLHAAAYPNEFKVINTEQLTKVYMFRYKVKIIIIKEG